MAEAFTVHKLAPNLPDVTPFADQGMNGLALWGVLFLVVVFLFYLRSMNKDQKANNESWRTTVVNISDAHRETFDAHAKRFDERQAETNAVLRNMTEVIAKK